jgi:hypothetical protein
MYGGYMRFHHIRAKILVIVLCVTLLVPSVVMAERQGELNISYQGTQFHMTLASGQEILFPYTNTVKVLVGSESYSMTFVSDHPLYGECLVYTGNGIEAVFDITSVGNPITGNSGAEADMAEFSLYITNTNSTDVTIGGLMFFDTMVGGNDRAPLYIPGVGKRTNESAYIGSDVPSTIYSYEVDDPASPGLVATFLTNYNGNIAPDRITLGNYGDLCASTYDYSATNNPIDDSAILAQWSNRTLAAGASAVFSMYMGRGVVTSTSGTVLSLSAGGDAQIGPDNTYKVMQTVRNISGSDLSDLQASISLPSGWSFAPGMTVPATRSSLAPNGDWVITWELIAPAGATSAVFPMSAQVGDDSSTLINMTYTANNIGASVDPTPSAQATPSFSPASGAVASGSSVTIVSDGAEHIYYTTDGTDPATAAGGSTLEYTAPITISENVTIKAIATKAGIPDSSIGSASYSVIEIEPTDDNVSSDGIGSAVQPAPDADGSGRVVIELSAELVSDSGSHANIAIAAQSLSGDGQQIAASYDISLIETLYDASDNLTRTGQVPAERITGDITVRLPVPAGFADAAGLVVVYIDDEGVMTYLPTTVVTIDGVKYLEFTTTHFSVYAIVCDNTASYPDPIVQPVNVEMPTTGSTGTIYTLWGLLAITASACTLFYIRRKQTSSK